MRTELHASGLMLRLPRTWSIRPACPLPTAHSSLSPWDPRSQNATLINLHLMYRLPKHTSPNSLAWRHARHVHLQELPDFGIGPDPRSFWLHHSPLLQQLQAASPSSLSGPDAGNTCQAHLCAHLQNADGEQYQACYQILQTPSPPDHPLTWTPCVFWAVRAVRAAMPNTPQACSVFRSAWMPAPPPGSEPATASTLGTADTCSRPDLSGTNGLVCAQQPSMGPGDGAAHGCKQAAWRAGSVLIVRNGLGTLQYLFSARLRNAGQVITHSGNTHALTGASTPKLARTGSPYTGLILAMYNTRQCNAMHRLTICGVEEAWEASLPTPFWATRSSGGSSGSPFPPLGSTNSPIWCQLPAVYSVPRGALPRCGAA